MRLKRTIFVLMALLLCGSGVVHAQVRPETTPGTSGGAAGIFPQFADSNQVLDTVPPSDIEPRTLLVSPEAFFKYKPNHTPAKATLPRFHVFDQAEQKDGFLQTLGQTGKPYRRYTYGLNSALFMPSEFINPVNGEEDVYMVDLQKGVRYYDTRTPYVNFRYDQGGRRLSIIDGELSQNITPFINAALRYRSRATDGAYNNNKTRQFHVTAATHMHTFRNRYQLFGAFILNDHTDEMNGGTFSSQPTSDLFDKQFEEVLLDNVQFVRIHRAARLLQMYRFNGDSSKSPHQFMILADFNYEGFNHSYLDETYVESRNSLPVPAYPTLDSSLVDEQLKYYVLRGKAAGSYHFEKNGFFLDGRGGWKFANRNYTQPDSVNFQDNRLTNFLEGGIGYNGKQMEAEGNIEAFNTQSSLFQAENLLHIDGNIKLGPRMYDYVEVKEEELEEGTRRWYEFVSHLPFSIGGDYRVYSRNPSYMESYYQGRSWNRYQGDASLRNQVLNHVRLNASYTGRSRKKGMEAYPAAPMVEGGGFFSNLENAIYFDSSATVRQANPTESLAITGAWLKFRVRLGKFYFENKTTWQNVSAPAGSGLETQYADYLPELYGRASLFFESREMKTLRALRVGFDFNYRTGYQGLFFDPAQQLFYGQSFDFNHSAYARIDFHLNVQLKRVHLYFRALHVNESLLLPGYFTTPYYPEMERTILFGVNWNFYD